MERHKTTQSHANGTTMGRFPRLTLVRLSPQVPDHMTVSPALKAHFSNGGAFPGADKSDDLLGTQFISGWSLPTSTRTPLEWHSITGIREPTFV